MMEVTADWLDAVLRENGNLEKGRVCSIRQAVSETTLSFIARLEVVYSEETPPAAPRRLLLKIPKPEALEPAQSEATFYRVIAPLVGGLPLVRCYSASSAHVLLEDISSTHHLLWDADDYLRSAELVVDSLAKLHALCWDDERFRNLLAGRPEHTLITNFVGSDRRYSQFADAFGDAVPREWRRIYETVLLQGAHVLSARCARDRHLTLCHPDAHGANFMVPRSSGNNGTARALIVDWHVYTHWWGAHDIARLIFFEENIDPDRRDILLRRYREKLSEYGVTGYSSSDFWQDYRLSGIEIAAFVLFYEKDLILAQVERAMNFYLELQCDEFF
jgi:hypothetical protein